MSGFMHSQRFAHAPVAPVALAALALLAACGGGSPSRNQTSGPAVAAVPPVVAPAESAGTSTNGIVVPADVTYEQADSVFGTRDYARATAMFVAYTQRRPANPWGHYMLGLSAWKAGQLDRADTAFTEALRLDPRNVKAMINLARVLLEQDRSADALTRVEQAVALDSGSVEAWRVLGRAQSMLRNVDQAVSAYHTALALEPQDAWSMNNLGLLLIRAGRYQDALGPLARAVQVDEHGVPSFRNNLGVALERTGHYALAAESYRAALEADSSYARARVSLARVDGRADEPGIDSVTVGSLGDAFAKEVDAWHAARDVAVVARPATARDSVKP